MNIYLLKLEKQNFTRLDCNKKWQNRTKIDLSSTRNGRIKAVFLAVLFGIVSVMKRVKIRFSSAEVIGRNYCYIIM